MRATVRGVIIAALTIGGVTTLAQSQLPPAKQAIEDQYIQERAAGALNPAEKNPLAPYPIAPEVPFETGIIGDCSPPFPSETLEIDSCWQGILDGVETFVYTGAEVQDLDPLQGVVVVMTAPDYPAETEGETLQTPIRAGAVHIVEASGELVTIESDVGPHRWIFNVRTKTFTPISGNGLTALSPAHLWIGLKNSDDQGTQFDVKVELLKDGEPIAQGLNRCVTGLTRNAGLARDAVAPFDAFDPVDVTTGDVLSLKVSARIGTKPDGTKCSGPGGSHGSATGLRLYYDSATRASRFGMTLNDDPSQDLYLHSDGGVCGGAESAGVTKRTLDGTAPLGANTRCKDSSAVNFAGGNPFAVLGTWTLAPLP